VQEVDATYTRSMRPPAAQAFSKQM